MREILFRGKRTEIWIYGSLVERKGNYFISRDKYIDEVSQETVGQFTGMLDKNGDKIFEGDILGWCGKREDWKDDEFTRLEMRWVDTYPPAFCAVLKNGDFYNSFELNRWCVVGNIHDNPELFNQETTHVVDSNG